MDDDLDDDEDFVRPSDHLVEPFYGGLPEGQAKGGRTPAGRGCALGVLLLAAVGLGLGQALF